MTTDDADEAWGWRGLTLMWVFAARLALARFAEATAEFAQALDADHHLEVWRERGMPDGWEDSIEDAKRTPVTDRLAWTAGVEQHYALNALAQVRKCVLALNDRGDTLPMLRDAKILRLLRDAHEHWEQAENGRSLAELRRIDPTQAPGRIVSTGKRHFIGDMSTDEIDDWLRDLDAAIRLDAADAGHPFPGLDQPLT